MIMWEGGDLLQSRECQNNKYQITAKCNQPCIHGKCVAPDTCRYFQYFLYAIRKLNQFYFRCTDGWKGSSCNECIALPGCVHGYCDGLPNTCKCIHGWQGHLCSQPVCRQGCNLTNGNCMIVR